MEKSYFKPILLTLQNPEGENPLFEGDDPGEEIVTGSASVHGDEDQFP